MTSDQCICPATRHWQLVTRYSQHGVAQLATYPIEDGCLEQELLEMGGLTCQDLLGQVVDHKAVTAGERGDKACHIMLPLHREPGELQPGDPALGARL